MTEQRAVRPNAVEVGLSDNERRVHFQPAGSNEKFSLSPKQARELAVTLIQYATKAADSR